MHTDYLRPPPCYVGRLVVVWGARLRGRVRAAPASDLLAQFAVKGRRSRQCAWRAENRELPCTRNHPIMPTSGKDGNLSLMKPLAAGASAVPNRRGRSDLVMTKGWVAVVLLAGAGLAARPCAARTQGPAAEEPARYESLSLETAISEAVDSSEELAALRERIAAAEASIRPAKSLPDPRISLAFSNVPVGGFDLDRTPMTGVELGIEQMVPASSKRRLKGETRSIGAEALRARYADRRNDTVRRVQRAYYDVQYYDAAVAIAEQNKTVAEDLLETAEARYATGKGLQQDVFRAQVRLSRSIDDQIAAKRGRAAAAARLNKLLYRPPDAPVPELPALEKEELPLNAAALRRQGVEANPRVAEALKRAEQADSEVGLAEAGLKPDFALGFRYRIRQEVPGDPAFGEDFWSAFAAMTLPWVYRRDTVDEDVKAASAALAAAEADLAALRNELAATVEELLVDIQRLDERIALLETGLLPQAEGALSSSWAAYETGAVEFLTVLDNQRNVYDLHLQRSRLLADHARALAELEYAVGGFPGDIPT